jgi:DNA-binding winged helix-turn-helix (wHTH) protein
MKEFPPFRLDETNQCLWRSEEVADERILLTPKAFAVLEFLIERAGRLVTQDELLEKLWPDLHIQPEVLKSHIAKIRRVLGDDPKRPRFIETAQRRGYRFIAPISEKLVESLAKLLSGESPTLFGHGVMIDFSSWSETNLSLCSTQKWIWHRSTCNRKFCLKTSSSAW